MKNSFITDISKLIYRVSVASFMLTHGFGKFKLLLSGNLDKFADPLGMGPEISLILAVGAEFFASIAIIIGFKTRLATIPIVFTMGVAAFVVHGSDPFSVKEFALLYMVAFIGIAIMGSGKYSIDYLISKYLRKNK
ncbi:MAG TPA: DoxX family protein [Bacteroidales bacterium]|jgi:putative oxidoreductase|nr:DoxX family protein [Bacteroidales bacterium]MDD4235174.1 DoxX family protein [Bacteroidales bacterium]MDY0160765.1 DoxX family protein [Bacteroidales bacterium]HXK82373.1 DoxX family protein [Bacteroidales bacterium]